MKMKLDAALLKAIPDFVLADGSLQSVAVDIIGASADSEIPSADSCVRSLEDESTLPAFGQTTRLNDLKKKTLTAARSTLQSVITSVNSKSYRSNLAASAGSSDRDVREGLKKSDQSSRGRGERPGFDPDFGQFILPGDSGPDAEGSELVGPEIYEAMDEFRRAHELIMVVPWMLKTRAMCDLPHHPLCCPLSSIATDSDAFRFLL